MIITRDWIMSNRTKRGAWTRSQIEALGLKWKPHKGWINRVVGNQIDLASTIQFESKLTAKEVKKWKIRTGSL